MIDANDPGVGTSIPASGSFTRQTVSLFGGGYGSVALSIPNDSNINGDGKADISVFRPSNGAWYLLKSRDGFAASLFGNSTDEPAPADYDGDGRTDVVVFRPADGTWYLMRSTQGFSATQFGLSTDKAAPNAYVP